MRDFHCFSSAGTRCGEGNVLAEEPQQRQGFNAFYRQGKIIWQSLRWMPVDFNVIDTITQGIQQKSIAFFNMRSCRSHFAFRDHHRFAQSNYQGCVECPRPQRPFLPASPLERGEFCSGLATPDVQRTDAFTSDSPTGRHGFPAGNRINGICPTDRRQGGRPAALRKLHLPERGATYSFPA